MFGFLAETKSGMQASDDFYPKEAASSHPHIAACAYNSLFLSVLCQPDWDMFQSKHPAAHLHACARAVSGGAVYVSDNVGRHYFDLLRMLVLRDGSVLRGKRPGLPTVDCIFSDPLKDKLTALKVRPLHFAPPVPFTMPHSWHESNTGVGQCVCLLLVFVC